MYQFVNPNLKWGKLEELVKKKLTGEKTGHDYAHVKRVLNNSMIIAKSMKCIDYDILTAADLLHDITFDPRYPKIHHLLSGDDAEYILQELNFPPQIIKGAKFAIVNHNRGFAQPPNTDEELTREAKVLCDADRIDGLGAIGIVRMISFSASQNIPYYISEEDKKDESFYGNFKYMLKLGDTLFTSAGKQLAKSRNLIMEQFLEKLRAEYTV